MTPLRRRARINVKAVIILGAVAIVLGVGAVAGHYVRKRVIADRALAEGQAAYEKEDWVTASKQFKLYLSKYAKDLAVLRKYAKAQISTRPLEPKNVAAAIAANRRIIQLDPGDGEAYEQLAALYTGVKNYGELAYVARKRLEAHPDDPKAPIWLAKALNQQHKAKEAMEALTGLIDRLAKRPEKHGEFVEACILAAQIEAGQGDSSGGIEKARKWLDKAIEFDPTSALAFAHRARFLRTKPHADVEALRKDLTAAEADLQKACALPIGDPRIYLMLSEEWMKNGRLDQAAAELKKAEGVDQAVVARYFLDPLDWVTTRFVTAAELSLRSNKVEEGVALANGALESLTEGRQRVPILPYAIRLYVAGRRPADARRCLREFIDAVRLGEETSGAEPRIAFLEALVAEAESQPYRVIEIAEPAVTQAGANPLLWLMLARAYEETGQPARAARVLSEYARTRPVEASTMVRLARLQLKQRKWAEALTAAQAAEARDSQDLTAKLLRLEAGIRLASREGGPTSRPKIDAIDKELSELVKAHPKRLDVRMLQAAAAQAQGRIDQAMAALKQAVQACDDPLLAELQLAQLAIIKDRKEEAIKICREACNRHPEETAAWQALADLQQSGGDVVGARATLQAGISKVAGAPAKHLLERSLALIEILHGDRKAGIQQLEGLAKKDPRDIRTRSLLLGLAEIRQNKAVAQKLIDEIRLIQGDAGLLWREQQAMLWLASDDWRDKQQEIASLLERCVDAAPGWSGPAVALGEMYERLGDLAKAESVYRRALSQQPEGTQVADRLIRLLQQSGRLSEANDVLAGLQASPDALSVRRIRLAIGSGKLDEAIRELKLRAVSEPDSVGTYLLLAQLTYRQTKDVEASLKYLDQAEKVSPKSLGVTSVRVGILRAAGRLDEARKLVDAQIKQADTFEARLLQASFLAEAGDLKAAEQAYRHLAKIGKDGQGEELLGDFYAETNRPDEAIATWEKAVKEHPQNLSLARRLMKGLLKRGKGDDRARATAMLARLEKSQPNDPDLLWVRALILLEDGTASSRNRARELLERVVQLRPTAEDAHLGLISLAMARGDHAAARELATRGQAASPNSRRLLLARVQAEFDLGNHALAERLAGMALTENPYDAEAADLLIRIAAVARDTKALQEAREDLEGAVAKRPDDGRLRVSLAKALHALGQTDTAIQGLEKYVGTEPGKGDIGVFLTLVDLHRAKKDWTAVANDIQQAEKLAPEDARVTLAKVLLFADQKQYDRIVELMRTYEQAKQSDAGVILRAASILATSKPHIKQAVELMEHVVKATPQSAEARHGLAILYYRSGDLPRAKELCRKLLEENPDNPTVLNDLAWILAEGEKNYGEALKLADKGVSLAPNQVNLRDTRGVILTHVPGRLKDARTDFQKVVDLTPADSPGRAKALLQLGRICAKLQDEAAAKQHLQESLRLDGKRPVLTDAEKAEIAGLLKGASTGK
ncbi:MAG: tetratricopeptide repeat protein [Phycisphaerae bacterium]|nr:tetratricopeptide repeat protein [Phycisphaerae bacterium]